MQLTLWKDTALRCTIVRQRGSREVSAVFRPPPTGYDPKYAVVHAAMRSSIVTGRFGMSRSTADGMDGAPNSIFARILDIVVSAESGGFCPANVVPANRQGRAQRTNGRFADHNSSSLDPIGRQTDFVLARAIRAAPSGCRLTAERLQACRGLDALWKRASVCVIAHRGCGAEADTQN